MLKHSLIIAALLLLAASPVRADQQETELTCGHYHAVCLYDDSQGGKLWEVQGIEAGSEGGTVINITTAAPRTLAEKIISGEVAAETSVNGNSIAVTLKLYRRCRCSGGAGIMQELTANPNQSCLDCCGQDGWSEDGFYFHVPVTVGWNGLELAVGWDPAQLILIERR